MAARKTAVSFDDIIQADRLRKKNEALAKDIFGRGRKPNPVSTDGRKLSSKSTFASRVGVAKLSQRSSSSTSNRSNLEAAWAHDIRHARGLFIPRSTRRETQPARIAHKERLYEADGEKSFRNGSSNSKTITGRGDEIIIRGLAGPCVVVGSNFAPGTTAADIESAMQPSSGGMQSCKIISYSPVLVAEMVFAEKAVAENVIATFHNKKADGRVLHVHMKQAEQKSTIASPNRSATQELNAPRLDLTRPDVQPLDLSQQESLHSESVRVEPITPDSIRPGTYDYQREQSDRNRRRAEPEIQDGSYGFESKDERMDVDTDNRQIDWRNDKRESDKPRTVVRNREERRLYSDDLYPKHHGRVFR